MKCWPEMIPFVAHVARSASKSNGSIKISRAKALEQDTAARKYDQSKRAHDTWQRKYDEEYVGHRQAQQRRTTLNIWITSFFSWIMGPPSSYTQQGIYSKVFLLAFQVGCFFFFAGTGRFPALSMESVASTSCLYCIASALGAVGTYVAILTDDAIFNFNIGRSPVVQTLLSMCVPTCALQMVRTASNTEIFFETLNNPFIFWQQAPFLCSLALRYFCVGIVIHPFVNLTALAAAGNALPARQLREVCFAMSKRLQLRAERLQKERRVLESQCAQAQRYIDFGRVAHTLGEVLPADLVKLQIDFTSEYSRFVSDEDERTRNVAAYKRHGYLPFSDGAHLHDLIRAASERDRSIGFIYE